MTMNPEKIERFADDIGEEFDEILAAKRAGDDDAVAEHLHHIDDLEKTEESE